MGSAMDATVVVPTFQREDVLLETLRALARVDYPTGRWEAVVVDDGSGGDTEMAVRAWIDNARAPIRYLRQSHAGPAAARNRGAAAGQGQVLIFIDNDIIVPPSFIHDHVETLAAHLGCWVVGRVIHPPELRRTTFGRYRDRLHESFHRAHPSGQLSEAHWMTAQNVSIPTQDFRRLGGFDESFTIASSEDWDLAWRARQIGIRVLYHPGIVVMHNDWAVSLERFCERQRLYSISDVLLWRKYGEASPRARLVRENVPVNWREDPACLIVKKALKRVLGIGMGRRVLRSLCEVAERLVPDSRLNRRFYELSVAVAIFRGVREGLKRYGSCAA